MTIANWPDKTINNNDAVQAVGADQPTLDSDVGGGLPGASFDSSDNMASGFALPQPFTIIEHFSGQGAPAGDQIIKGDSIAYLGMDSSGRVFIYAGSKVTGAADLSLVNGIYVFKAEPGALPSSDDFSGTGFNSSSISVFPFPSKFNVTSGTLSISSGVLTINSETFVEQDHSGLLGSDDFTVEVNFANLNIVAGSNQQFFALQLWNTLSQLVYIAAGYDDDWANDGIGTFCNFPGQSTNESLQTGIPSGGKLTFQRVGTSLFLKWNDSTVKTYSVTGMSFDRIRMIVDRFPNAIGAEKVDITSISVLDGSGDPIFIPGVSIGTLYHKDCNIIAQGDIGSNDIASMQLMSNGLAGKKGASLVYNRALSDSEISQIIAYLGKYT
jgi:hypothetical protein